MIVVKSTLLASIQDEGRFGYRALGVPISGCMDSGSANMANAILGNNLDAAIMEISGSGLIVRAEENTQIAFSGAEVDVFVGGKLTTFGQEIPIFPDEEIKIGRFKRGNFLYLAAKGGFPEEEILGSRSWYPSLSPHYTLEVGKRWELPQWAEQKPKKSRVKITSNFAAEITVQVYEGPEYHLLDEESKENLFSQTMTLTEKISRMGFQIESTGIGLKNSFSMFSSAVFPGTVQLLPSGNLIALMKDAQTTGGYPRILQITEEDISRLSQLGPAGKIRFQKKEVG